MKRTDHDTRIESLSEDDAKFVSRMAEVYRAPKLSAAERVAFQAKLDRRLQQGRGVGLARGWALGAAAATVAITAWFVFGTVETPLAPQGAAPPQVAWVDVPEEAVVTPEEALLALSEDVELLNDDLPDEYEAIASLFLGDA